MSITDIGREQAQAILGSETADSTDDYETPTYFPLDQYPTTVIGGTATELRPCGHSVLDEHWAGLVLTDPFVYTEDAELKSTAIFSHTEEDGFTVVNLGNDEADSFDGAVIRPDNTAFRANQVKSFEDAEGFDPSIDQVTVRLTGREGKYTLLYLEANGLQQTGISRDSSGVPECTDDDNLFDGIPPGCSSDAIQLRSDLEGEEVVLMRQYADDVLDGSRVDSPWPTAPAKDSGTDSHWPTVLARDSGAEDEFSVVDPNVDVSLEEERAGRLSHELW